MMNINPNLYQSDVVFTSDKQCYEVLSNSAHLVHYHFDRIFPKSESFVRLIRSGYDEIKHDYPYALVIGYPLNEA